MRIVVVTNKTLPRNGKNELDTGLRYLVDPLVSLGHTVELFDTVSPDKPFDALVDEFCPDLVFCCLTGNPNHTPHEPISSILRLTRLGKVKTFNWFCDDTWRFNSFSSPICWAFDHCSTPEPSYVERYKEIGYDNIHLATWHASVDCFPDLEKDIDISFVGGITPDRQQFFASCEVPITGAQGLSIDELFQFYSRTRIGVNLSVNANDPEKKTQMKLRPFELAAAKCLVLTEYNPGIEEFFELDKEIITFSGVDEFKEKVNYLMENPDVVERVAEAGHKRFLKDHESKVRLSKLLEDIMK